MNFKELLLQAKFGDRTATTELLMLYQPLLLKESIIDGILDEDLYQELCIVFMRCIDRLTHKIKGRQEFCSCRPYSSSETCHSIFDCRHTILSQQFGSVIKGDLFGFDRLFLRRLSDIFWGGLF